jgi:hypothetical protein
MNGLPQNMYRLPGLRAVLFASLLAIQGLDGQRINAQSTPAGEPEPPAEAPSQDVQPPPTAPLETDPSITLKGAVWRTKAGIVFLKTPVGLLTLSSKSALKDLKASHEVSFWVHQRHLVVEIRRRSDGSLVHRYLGGPMTPGPDSSKMLRYWTPDGEQSVHYGTQEAKISAFHDLQFDLQISQTPPAGSSAHVLLSGSVSKTKSNFVFFRTPVGVVMVNAKIGVPPVKVGQSLTLHIDNGRVSVVVLKSTKPTT